MGYENPLAIQPIAKTGSLNKQPDQSLIKAIAASDQRAMRALYERHSSGVLRFISRLNVDVGEAEDLLSEESAGRAQSHRLSGAVEDRGRTSSDKQYFRCT